MMNLLHLWCVSHRIIGESKGFFIFWATNPSNRSGEVSIWWLGMDTPATSSHNLLVVNSSGSWVWPIPVCHVMVELFGGPQNWMGNLLRGWSSSLVGLGWEYAQTTWGIWDRRSNKFCRSNLGTIHWQAPLSENEQWKWIVNPDFECLIVP